MVRGQVQVLRRRARPHAVLAVAVLVVVALAWWLADPAVAVLFTLAGVAGLANDVLRTQAEVTGDGLLVRRRARETTHGWHEVRSAEVGRSAGSERLVLGLDDGQRVPVDLDEGAAERVGAHLRPHQGGVRLTDAARERLGLSSGTGPGTGGSVER